MAWSLVASTSAVGTPSSVTTSAINTTGASHIFIGVSVDSANALNISDSKGNTWTALTPITSGSTKSIIYYAQNATVGTGHTFTNAGSENYSTIYVAAFSGGALSSSFDQENGLSGAVNTLQTGSVTPTENNELVITHVAFNSSGTPISINGGFTETPDERNFGAGNNYGGGLAYLIQTTATAANPTWTRTNTDQTATRIATFKAAAASVSPSATPSTSVSASPSPSSGGSGIPDDPVGLYWAYWDPVQRLVNYPTTYSVIFLFQCAPVGGAPGSTGAVTLLKPGGTPGTFYNQDIATCRARGQKIIMTIGGAGAQVDITTKARADAFVQSVKDINVGLGGSGTNNVIDGIDWNNFEQAGSGNSPVYMTYASLVLKDYYGSDFLITSPPACSDWDGQMTTDRTILATLQRGGTIGSYSGSALDWMCPQYYDGSGNNTIAQIREAADFYNTAINISANADLGTTGTESTQIPRNKIGIGFRIGGESTSWTTTNAANAYATIVADGRDPRGAFNFANYLDTGNTFATNVAPTIAGATSASSSASLSISKSPSSSVSPSSSISLSPSVSVSASVSVSVSSSQSTSSSISLSPSSSESLSSSISLSPSISVSSSISKSPSKSVSSSVSKSLSLSISASPSPSSAGWVAEEHFDSYSAGDLVGQNGGSGWSDAWTGDLDYDVTTAQFYDSPNSCGSVNANGSIFRTLTTPTGSGTVYFAMKCTAMNSDFQIGFFVGESAAVYVSFRNTDNIEVLGDTTVVLLDGFSTSTWYLFEMTYNGATADFRYHNGTAWSSPQTVAYSVTGVFTKIVINSGADQTAYVDYISGVDPLQTSPSASVSLSPSTSVSLSPSVSLSSSVSASQSPSFSPSSSISASPSPSSGWDNLKTKHASSWSNRARSF